VLLQEKVERETEATLGKTAWAAMTCHATIGEQPWSRFALVEILGAGRAAQNCDGAKGKQTTSQQIALLFLSKPRRCTLPDRGVVKLGLIDQQHCPGKIRSTRCRTLEMTEYVIREVSLHQWLVFADRKCIASCADENEAEKTMTEHSARGHRISASTDIAPRQSPPGLTGGP